MLLKRKQTVINLMILLQRDFVQILNKNVFAAGDSVEAFDYNPDTRRLVVSSHYGHVSLFSHIGGELNCVWSRELPDSIPRAVQFHRGGVKTILVFALETGKMWVSYPL